MALTLSKVGISQNNVIEAFHVTQSIDALTGTEAYDITISGSFTLSGGTTGSGYFASAVAANSIRPQNVTANTDYTMAYLSGTGSVATMYYSALGPTYNPISETITSTNFEGTASYATTASYAETSGAPSEVLGTTYPSASGAAPSLIKLVAGADQTGNAPNTVAINITELTGKILGQNCFVTATPSGSAINNGLSVVGLLGSTLTFESQNPNTDFYYTIMYV